MRNTDDQVSTGQRPPEPGRSLVEDTQAAPIQILLIEDNTADARLVHELLDEAVPGGFALTSASCLADGLQCASQARFDVVLLDLGLPDSAGTETFRRARDHVPDLPFVIISGAGGTEQTAEALRLGAQDYLVKGRVDAELLSRTLSHAIERKMAANAVRASDQRVRMLIECSPDGSVVLDRQGRILMVNPAAEWLFGRCRDELIGADFGLPLIAGEKVELDLQREAGDIRTVEMRLVEITWESDPILYASLHDITDRKLATEKLAHLNAVLHALRNVNQLITKERDPERTLQGICDNLVEHRSYTGAWIATFNNGGKPTRIKQSGIGESFEPLRERLGRGELPACAALAIEHGAALVIDDPGKVCADCALPERLRCSAAIAAPLLYGDRLHGVLSVSIPGDLAIDEEELALFDEVAGDVSFALHGLEQEQRRDTAEQSLAQRAQQLAERVRELRALHAASELTSDRGKTLEEMLQGIVDLLPPAMQHKEHAGARLVLDGQEYRTNGFVEMDFLLSTEIRVHSEPAGRLEIGFIEERPATGEGPFLAEEQELLESLARKVGQFVESRRAEFALRESEGMYRNLIGNLVDVVMEIDSEGKFSYVSPQVLDVFGYTPEESVGLDAFSFVHPDDLSKCMEAMATTDEVKVFEYRSRHKDGHYIEVSTTGRIVPDGCGGLKIVSIVKDISELKRTEFALRESEVQLSNALQMAQAGHWEYGVDSDVFTFNDSFYRIFRTTAAEQGGYQMSSAEYARRFCHPDDAAMVEQEVQASLETDDPEYSRQIEHRILYADGEVGYITVRFFIVKDSQGRTVSIFGVNQDITAQKLAEQEREQLEEQLRQSSRMEAIGQLAGGVAHDFNNLLTAILGNCELLDLDIEQGSPLRGGLKEISKAGQRAVSLTRQLLAFSRRQVLQPVVLDLNAVIPDVDKMLRRLLGEDIDLSTTLAPELGRVRADPGQLEQVLMNLAVNARDAMPGGGRLTIETQNVKLDEEYAASHIDVQPGPHVLLVVSDTGDGMDAQTRARAFEPFFTTKDKGKGTGLGLATVYGIVKQSGGNIWIYSEPGQGTTFKIYLPRIDEPAETIERSAPAARAEAPRGSETVLVVEDDAAVRSLTARILERGGYEVLTAQDGAEALYLSDAEQGPIQLLLTDVVMPGQSGRQVAASLLEQRPEMKVLFMSGYTDNAIVHHGVLEEGTAFIQKPFTPEELARRVREVLDRGETEHDRRGAER